MDLGFVKSSTLERVVDAQQSLSQASTSKPSQSKLNTFFNAAEKPKKEVKRKKRRGPSAKECQRWASLCWLYDPCRGCILGSSKKVGLAPGTVISMSTEDHAIVFEHEDYRGEQKSIVESAVKGTLYWLRVHHNPNRYPGKDVFVVAPTGMGKACYVDGLPHSLSWIVGIEHLFSSSRCRRKGVWQVVTALCVSDVPSSKV